MFTKPAFGQAEHHAASRAAGAACRSAAGRRACSGLGEVFGELPVVCMREEIETPGEGQIRALITIAGNPVLSTPDGDKLADALDDARADGLHRPVHQRDDAPRAT